jgi:threonine/homoserine/homoserine lactone efflux protein
LLNNIIMYDPRRAILVLSSDLAAIVIFASFSAAGIGALLAADATLFTVLRLGGAVYLLWLGLLLTAVLRDQQPQGNCSRWR